MELIGFDSAMMAQIYKMSSAMLCSTSAGQVGCLAFTAPMCTSLPLQMVTDVLVNPPRPGEASHETFQKVHTYVCLDHITGNVNYLF